MTWRKIWAIRCKHPQNEWYVILRGFETKEEALSEMVQRKFDEPENQYKVFNTIKASTKQ